MTARDEGFVRRIPSFDGGSPARTPAGCVAPARNIPGIRSSSRLAGDAPSSSNLRTVEPAVVTSLVELLARRATTAPRDQGYTFLTDGEQAEAHLGFAALDRRARALASRLQQLDAAGERALLLYPPGLEYVVAFFGCLYAKVIAVPAYPPDPSRLAQTLPRIQAIACNAGAKVVLTTSEVLAVADLLRASASDLAALHWEATDGLDDAVAGCWIPPTIGPDSIAFLQYTSGSTGEPKGAIVSHGNLLHNSATIQRCFGCSTDSRAVIWLPPYHDMGLIGGILQPLYAGFPAVLMSPMAFLRRPSRWLRAISRYGATVSGGPNFAYDLCVRRVSERERAELDLSSWRAAFNGAEPVRSETLDRFAEAFAPCGFRPEAFLPCYGLAEATLFVTGTAHDELPARCRLQAGQLQRDQVVPAAAGEDGACELIAGGRLWGQDRLLIVDPERRVRCQPGRIGEIWVAGPSVVGGYWQAPETAAESFGATLAGDSECGPFLRSGDLGFVHDGQLYVTGRLKDLIIIRGRNYYPHDIELAAEQSHLAVRPGRVVAFAVENKGAEQPIIVCELRSYDRDLQEVCDRIAREVTSQRGLHIHTVCLVEAGELPKTSSGKLQRRETRQRFIERTLKEVFRSGPVATPAVPVSEFVSASTRASSR